MVNETPHQERLVERYSFSKLSSWWVCPYGYFLRYIEHKAGIGNAFASYGTLVHEIMEKYAKGEAELWDLPQMFEWLFDSAVQEKFPPNKYVDLRESYYKQGLDFLKTFSGYDKYKILGVEEEFEMSVDDWNFVGVIDLVFEDEDGRLIIRDYKSKASFKNEEEQHKYARQLYLYALYVKEKYRCGLRLGEAFAITWDCVDLEKGQIYINKQVQWNPAEQWWFFTNPKFNSFRTIDLDNTLLELLRRERKRQDKDRAYYEEMYTVYYENDVRGLVTSPDGSSTVTPVELMLVRQDGSYIQARTMQHASSVIHYELGVKDFTFHSLRHTHATMLAEAGMPQKYTQQRLGHKDISVTLKYYTHLTDKMSEIGGKILESMFADEDD